MNRIPLAPMPTPEQVAARAYLPPALRALCVALTVHGINTDNMPRRPDAITADGYLTMTGTVTDDEIDFERRPWPTPTAWREIEPLIAPGLAEL